MENLVGRGRVVNCAERQREQMRPDRENASERGEWIDGAREDDAARGQLSVMELAYPAGCVGRESRSTSGDPRP